MVLHWALQGPSKKDLVIFEILETLITSLNTFMVLLYFAEAQGTLLDLH